MDILASQPAEAPICIFMESDHMHFYCPDVAITTEVFQKLMENDISDLTPGGLLYCFLSQRLSGDREWLEKLETSLNSLDEEILTGSSTENYNRRFMTLRKHLVHIKRYYEQLGDLFGELSDNENGLFDKRALKHLALLDGKVTRLCQKTERDTEARG